jgi:hypothetical protein
VKPLVDGEAGPLLVRVGAARGLEDRHGPEVFAWARVDARLARALDELCPGVAPMRELSFGMHLTRRNADPELATQLASPAEAERTAAAVRAALARARQDPRAAAPALSRLLDETKLEVRDGTTLVLVAHLDRDEVAALASWLGAALAPSL